MLEIDVNTTPYCFSPFNVVQTVAFSSLAGIVSGGPNLFYIADSGNSTVYQFDPATQTATVWAGTTGVTGTRDGIGTAAMFNNPTGLAVDSSGNVYVADTANSTIRKISSTGVVTTLAGVPGEPGSADGASTAAHFNYPQAVAVDSSGNVYVVDTGNSTIRQISPSGNVTTFAGTAGIQGDTNGTGSAATFEKPTAIVIDSKGNLYVEDFVSGNLLIIRKISPGAVVTTVTTQNLYVGMGSGSSNLAIDSSDNLYFIVPNVNLMVRSSVMTGVTPIGETFNLGPLSPNYTYVPIGMAFDQSGHIFATSATSIDEGLLASGPSIVSQPTIDESETNVAYPEIETIATVSVTASSLPAIGPQGGSALSYQWFLNGSPVSQGYVPGYANFPPQGSFVTLVNASTVGTYSVLITDAFGGAIMSDGVTLTPIPVSVITTQPASQAVLAGANATFTVVATGTPSPTYQWTYNGTPIAGATNASYTVSNVQVSNSGAYAVTVTYTGGSQSSQSAFLTVTNSSGGPTIADEPQSYTTYPGGTVVLALTLSSTQAQSVGFDRTADATTGITYQWYYNGSALADVSGISGSQTATLVLSGTATRAGSYACLVENSVASVLSNPATLSLSQTEDIGRLINVSCRAHVGTGSNILIAGFVIGGNGTSGSESLLIRGSGPALVPFGVTGTLPDPELQLYSTASGDSLLGKNTGWGGNSLIASTATSVGAFAWTDSSSHDAAFLADLAQGPYTANVSGESGDSGVALAEVYDATPEGTYTPATPRLVNISARVQVGTGSNILIAGFVIGGSTSKTVLVRASGPALIPFGVSGTLPDPQLQLYQSNSNGTSTLIASNTGWGGSTPISTEGASVGAFSWGTSATPDSAILITLPPGAYTAQVSGAGSDTGVALVEVYEVQ